MESEIYFKLLLTLGLILVAARIGGEIAERYLKQPAIIGELLAGIIISPFAIGGLITDPAILDFATIEGTIIGSGEHIAEFHPLEIISQLAVIALLFIAGLETDVRSFLKHSVTGTMVAIGGVVLPFVLGYFSAMYFFPDIGTIGWLFIGAVLTATSIGITVRIFMDMGRLNSKEGMIILVAAVVDDIIGLVILSIVVSMADTGEFSALEALKTAGLGFGIWIALLTLGVKGHKFISRFVLQPFRESGTMPMVALILAILISYIVTLFGLHPVVGAYVAGLMIASTVEKEEIMKGTRPIMAFLAPFFFAYLGMQVDLAEIWVVIIPAIVIVALAVISKVGGCYLPARLFGKTSHKGAMVVGIGMVPRGEVGLIIAGAGLLSGVITRDLFGVAIAVSIVTVLIVPTMLKPFFKKSGAQPKEGNPNIKELV